MEITKLCDTKYGNLCLEWIGEEYLIWLTDKDGDNIGFVKAGTIAKQIVEQKELDRIDYLNEVKREA